MNEEKRVIEINGVKMEGDLRHAKRIDNYHIGDRCKVLKKEYSGYRVHYGVIVDFAEFNKLPSIEILTVDPNAYNDALSFVTFNTESKDIEIAPLGYLDEFFAKENIRHFEKTSIDIS